MELLQLRYFRTVAQLENVTRAAEHHHIPQPAMSLTISRLEKEIGRRLFDRQRGRLVLNEEGRFFLSYVNRALDLLDDGMTSLFQREDEIRVLCTANARFVLEKMRAYNRIHPEIAFMLSTSPRENERFDLAVTFEEPVDSPGKERLSRHRIQLAVPADSALAREKRVSFGVLRSRGPDCMVALSKPSGLSDLIEAKCRQHAFAPACSAQCEELDHLARLVSLEMGAAFVPEGWLDASQCEGLRLIDVEEEGFEISVWLSGDEHRFLTPAIRAFRQLLLGQSGPKAENR